jgi:hypothetical protein
MTEDAGHVTQELPPHQLLEALLADQERRWRQGDRAHAEDYLREYPALRADGDCAVDLVYGEFVLREALGEGPDFADYLRRFPDLAAGLRRLYQVDPERLLAAGRPATAPTADSGRFPGYELLGEIGRGGAGVVYKARQLLPPRLVALKVLHAGVGEAVRFRVEAEAIARLRHPNIVQVYEVGQRDGPPHLALEYVDGDSLARRLAGTPLPAPEAARLVQTLAEAMHHAHQMGVVHRDLKPANVLLASPVATRCQRVGDTEAHTQAACGYEPKIADFGLAKLLGGDGSGPTESGAVLGTPSYMAPEQAGGGSRAAGPAVDVYALGAILYECLTGRPPFKAATSLDTMLQVLSEEPVPPRRLLPGLPRDLETVCLKCLDKDPRRRYATAQELADELKRFLAGEPVRARPVGRPARLWRWGRRNPWKAGLAAAMGVLLPVVFALLVAMLQARGQATRDLQYQNRVQRLQALLQSPDKFAGWSDEAWRLVQETAALHPEDDRLRVLAGTLPAAVDARCRTTWQQDRGASWVAFDRAGRRLLLGGTCDAHRQLREPARLWDPTAGTVVTSQEREPGPVAFRADDTPLHLVPLRAGPALLVWDLARQQAVSTCRFGSRPRPIPDLTLRLNDVDLAVAALSADGTRAAAAAAGPHEAGVLAVWETATGERLFQWEGGATALAFAPTGDRLAAACPDWWLRVWSVPDNRLLAKLTAPRAVIHCLAFSADGERLAVGDAGSGLTIWDVANRRPPVRCYGSPHDVYAVAFSPDGTTLASGGRSHPRLWDVVTGRLLLELDGVDYLFGLAFSPDGKRLAAGARDGHGTDGLLVWDLSDGGGLRALRGLTAPASLVCLSPNGRLVAALAHDWEVAVWDLGAGRLLHTFPVDGISADNAALAFNADGSRLAFTAGKWAHLWDTAGGQELRSWDLSPGLVDQLLFPSPNELLLMRVETRGGKEAPLSAVPVEREPRVCRLRNLLEPGPGGKVLKELPDFNRRVFGGLAVHDAGCFILDGDGDAGRYVKAFDARTGEVRWQLPSTYRLEASFLAVDPGGRVLVTRLGDPASALVEISSGQRVGDVEAAAGVPGPGVRFLVRGGQPGPSDRSQGIALYRPSAAVPFAELSGDRVLANSVAFSADGSLLVWGNLDGTVIVCQLESVRRQLGEIGLGWEP